MVSPSTMWRLFPASAAVLAVLLFLSLSPCRADLDLPARNVFSSPASPGSPFHPSSPSKEDGGQCFCQLKGQIDDCLCNVDTVDYFNNMKIFPRLQSLVLKPYFRYFRYNPRKPCPFWNDSSEKCSSVNCNVRSCQTEEVPSGLQDEANKGPHSKYTEEAQETDACGEEEKEEEEDALNGKVDATISEEDRANLARWQKHDNSLQNFCDIDTDLCPDCEFVDLAINPERYTGFSGEASHRIWRSIYEENCFRPPNSDAKKGEFSAAFLQDSLDDLCLEKRAFYRAVSGLHTSITIHLCANYLLSDGGETPFADKKFGPNLEEFLRRFDPEQTNSQGPYWLRNLYFVYLLELRALTKVAPYLERQSFYTGSEEEDKDTQIAVKELLNLMRSFPDHFDERVMFAGGQTAAELKAEFREHFLNITRIMDCVGCAKCRLWGKLQITGLGTALKILFAEEPRDPEQWAEELTELRPPPEAGSPAPVLDADNFKLTRNEIVALFNAFARISTSIQQLEKFRHRVP